MPGQMLEHRPSCCENHPVDTTPLLSVLVPVYNEAGTLRTLLERVRAVPFSKQIVVVDDCSTDGTRDVVRQLADEFQDDDTNQLVVRYHERNQGKGAAIRTGSARRSSRRPG
jgi:glycosyltransferase involved in cell wall biosynthesis